MSFVTTFCYNSVGLEGNELPLHLHEQEGKGEEARDVESFWLLCKFLRAATQSYPRTCWTQGLVRAAVNIRGDLI